MKIKLFLNYYPRPLAWIVFFISLVITQLIAYGIFSVEKENELLQVKQEAENTRNQLESSLNHSITATKILSFLAEEELLGNYFDTVAQQLLDQNKFMDALQLVKGNTILKTYPLEGNEATIGYRIMENPMHRQEALKAFERRQLYFEGPFNLIQGGVGIVGRLPIFENGELWGFTAVVIRVETLLKAIGIESTGRKENYLYQLVKYNEDGSERGRLFDHKTDCGTGIYHETFSPIGDWHIFVKLEKPLHLISTLPFSLLGIIFSALLALFLRHLAAQPQKLKALVDEKTRDLERLNRKLENHARELMLSNKELEEFAYVASHDLQEPLRMISTFMNQLKKKYGDQLDEKAHSYIHFAVDGAKRMRQIILDILEFSRVGKHAENVEEINVNEVVKNVCLLQRRAIETKKASISFQGLPTIVSYRAPLAQVLQNLIANALKYSKPDVPPEITISARELAEEWEFSVSDNGIGIEPQFYDKIFIIFQRLHNKNDYEGTGVGLAIVKKTIENLGGRVWLESKEGSGATFFFTIPKILNKQPTDDAETLQKV